MAHNISGRVGEEVVSAWKPKLVEVGDGAKNCQFQKDTAGGMYLPKGTQGKSIDARSLGVSSCEQIARGDLGKGSIVDL
jgi:hypothetical protein